MTPGRRRRVDEIPVEQFAVVSANIRVLRQRKGWTQAELGELMGWPTTATCAQPKATATAGNADSLP